jgi:glycosyltransferase involved in cell wall biosynthesis
VVLPVYNAGAYLAQAIESILAQTYREFEFIILDDGSTDDSLAIIERFAARDRRIRYVSRPNAGLVATLNEGLSMARGEYVARMDADDVCQPWRFARQLELLDRDASLALCGSAVNVIDGQGRPAGFDRVENEDATIKLSLLWECPLNHPSVMYRRSAVVAVGGYRSIGIARDSYAEDYDLWIRLAGQGRYANLPEPLLNYRWHGGNICLRHREQQAESALEIAAAHVLRLNLVDRLEDARRFVTIASSTGRRGWADAVLYERVLSRYLRAFSHAWAGDERVARTVVRFLRWKCLQRASSLLWLNPGGVRWLMAARRFDPAGMRWSRIADRLLRGRWRVRTQMRTCVVKLTPF